MSLRNLDVGQVVIYSDHEQVQLWRPGNCSVTICDPDTGHDVDVYNWMEPPVSIDQAIRMAGSRQDDLLIKEREENWKDDDDRLGDLVEDLKDLYKIKNSG